MKKQKTEGNPLQRKNKMKKQKEIRELQIRKSEFQQIVKTLVQFDELTGRFRHSASASHFARKIISLANEEDLIVVLQELGENNFLIFVGLDSDAKTCVTWIHEDSIVSERVKFSDDREHPVHSITCMTDLWESAGAFNIESLSPHFSEYINAHLGYINTQVGTLAGSTGVNESC